jgi:hypothetical protein
MVKTTRPAENSRKLPSGKPFQPGQSGNKGGRPRKTDEERTLEQMCRAKTLDALAVLTEIMDSKDSNERNRITAAMAIIERGHGKAVQPTTVSGPDGGPVDMNWTVEFVKPKK